jgi:CP family cyanate transporter-like MFS transporter
VREPGRGAFPWSVPGFATLLVAANLRPAIASVGPVLTQIRSSLHMSGVAISVLSALPVVCFGAGAAAGPLLARRVGLGRSIGWFAALLAIGLAIRVGPDAAMLFVGTVIAATAIAANNVLLPALVKAEYARHIGLMMGFYALALTGSAALGAGLSVPFAHAVGGGWRTALGIWAGFAAIAAIGWAIARRGPHRRLVIAAPTMPMSALFRDRVAWTVTAYFGLQSLSFYAVLSWLPTLFEEHGYSVVKAGALMSISAAVQTPIALTLPPLLVKVRRQGWLVLASAALTAAGLLLVLTTPTSLPYVWVIVLGLGQGMAFPLALMFVVERSRTPAAAQQLSAMSQGIGYLIAATGPLLVGVLHSFTGGWQVPLLLLLALVVPQAVFGAGSARPRFAAG